MKKILITLLFCTFCAICSAKEYTFEGPWHTTNRKLDGIQTCVVNRFDKENWQGKFYGIWQGVEYEYTVKFSGPSNNLHGTATIDGADYEWTGSITKKKFIGSFTGDRYTGHFEMDGK